MRTTKTTKPLITFIVTVFLSNGIRYEFRAQSTSRAQIISESEALFGSNYICIEEYGARERYILACQAPAITGVEAPNEPDLRALNRIPAAAATNRATHRILPRNISLLAAIA